MTKKKKLNPNVLLKAVDQILERDKEIIKRDKIILLLQSRLVDIESFLNVHGRMSFNEFKALRNKLESKKLK